MEEQKFSRKELYDLVWSVSLLTLSKKYLISDNGLRKICKKMNIPLPKAGHWEKLKFNKKVEIEELSENFEGEGHTILKIRKEGETTSGSERYSEIALREQEIIALEGDKLKVPERLTNPCDWIIEAKEDMSGRIQKRNYLFHSFNEIIGVKISPNLIGRALRIMDTFIKIMQGRGYQFSKNRGEVVVNIRGEAFQIRCYEKHLRVPRPEIKYYQEYDFIPS